MKSIGLSDRFSKALAKRSALLGLLAILLGQVALVAHDAVFDHADDDSCLVCHLSDRQDDAVELADAGHPISLAAGVLAPAPATSPAPNAPRELHARGPPTLL